MAKTRTEVEREEDLVVTAELYKRSWSMRRVAKELSKRRPYAVSHVTIKNDIDEVLLRWKEKQSGIMDNFIASRLEQIQALKEEAWNEYLRSKESFVMKREQRKALVPGADVQGEAAPTENESSLDDIFSMDVSKTESKVTEYEETFTDLSEFTLVEVNQVVQITDKIGNPRFLEIVAKLIDQEAKLLGFYKEDKSIGNTSVIVVQSPAPVPKEWFMPNKNDF